MWGGGTEHFPVESSLKTVPTKLLLTLEASIDASEHTTSQGQQ